MQGINPESETRLIECMDDWEIHNIVITSNQPIIQSCIVFLLPPEGATLEKLETGNLVFPSYHVDNTEGYR